MKTTIACSMLLALTLLAQTTPAASSLTTLITFNGSNGSNPSFIIQGSDGNFYGVTQDGGSSPSCNGSEFSPNGGCGTMFQITPAGTLKTLYSFSGTDGAFPIGALLEAAPGACPTMCFYGTTLLGGASNVGTTFKFTMQSGSSGTLQVLHQFSGDDGSWPAGGLALFSDGNLYGVSSFGGVHGHGNIYQMSPADGSTKTVYAFLGGARGAQPTANLVVCGKSLVGTTTGGAGGTLFAFNPTTDVLTILLKFDGSDGSVPCAPIYDASGVFYGTTAAGGAYNDGTVWKYNSKALTDLYDFDFPGTPTISPGSCSQPVKSGSLLYGITNAGGAFNDGIVYSVETNGSNYKVLFTFDGADGKFPYGIIQGSDGAFYGTTYYGGFANQGTVFRLVM
jgi:uncharacterized repeat protein (TIGR03803 family)